LHLHITETRLDEMGNESVIVSRNVSGILLPN